LAAVAADLAVADLEAVAAASAAAVRRVAGRNV
jgi:hypothetical protein